MGATSGAQPQQKRPRDSCSRSPHRCRGTRHHGNAPRLLGPIVLDPTGTWRPAGQQVGAGLHLRAGPDACAPGPVGRGDRLTRVTEREHSPAAAEVLAGLTRDISEVPAIEVITTCAVNLMSAAAVKLGLAEGGEQFIDLDEARTLIEALAGLVEGARPHLSFHAAPVLDGLQTLQAAFREASPYPDARGLGPGEKYRG